MSKRAMRDEGESVDLQKGIYGKYGLVNGTFRD
jgi:hypothetical protein